MWLVCIAHSIKGKMRAVNVRNLQIRNGFLADPKGRRVFYLCLSVESLLDCQTLLQL